MQAIARANRVFKDKEGGVVVDYIGILESLKRALKEYTDSDKKNTGIDTVAAIAIMLGKLETRGKKALSKAEIEQRINQMLERSIISEEVIDVFEAMGMKRPDVSILDEEFLEEVKVLKTKNLALEMLKKLLEGEIKVMEKSNLVKSELFSEKLKKALNKYRNQAVTNPEVIEELIRMAKEIKKMHAEEAKLGLNKDEIAFYYALSKDEVAREFYDDATLKKIAQELTDAIRRNVTIDFNVRAQAQAAMRSTIRRLLKKYDYPPKQALEVVMKQVELMCSNEVSTYDEMMDLPMVAEARESYRVH